MYETEEQKKKKKKKREEYEAWLASLKVGDEVMLRDSGVWTGVVTTLYTIGKATPQRLYLRDDRVQTRFFHRATGQKVGGHAYNSADRLHKPTDELRTEKTWWDTLRACQQRASFVEKALREIDRPECPKGFKQPTIEQLKALRSALANFTGEITAEPKAKLGAKS